MRRRTAAAVLFGCWMLAGAAAVPLLAQGGGGLNLPGRRRTAPPTPSEASATVLAGVASRVVTPDLKLYSPVYLAGFDHNRVATGVHDDLYARCFALRLSADPAYRGVGSADPGPGRPRLTGKPLVMCGVDSIGLFLDDVEKIRAKVRDQAGAADVVVASLHDHEAPDTMGLWGPAEGRSGINEAYNAFVVEGTAQAAVEAIRNARPARLAFGKIHTPELDTMISDSRPPVVHDAEIVVLTATALAGGQRIGTLINWANHPEALGSRNTLITSDYSGYLRTTVEKRTGGMAVLINGAVGGMQSPLGARPVDPLTGKTPPKDTFEFAELVGRRAGELAAEAVEKAQPQRVTQLIYRESTIEIPIANAGYRLAAQFDIYRGRKKLTAGGGTATPVGYIRLGEGPKAVLEIALIPGELYPELSVGGIERYPGADFPDARLETPAKKLMTAPYRMLFGLANDEIGYIIPVAEWDEKAPWLKNAERRPYGEVNSVGPEAAPRILGELERLTGPAPK